MYVGSPEMGEPEVGVEVLHTDVMSRPLEKENTVLHEKIVEINNRHKLRLQKT